MHDLGLYGVETCRGQRYRYQTPLKLLIYTGPFGNYERVTDCSFSDWHRINHSSTAGKWGLFREQKRS